MADTLLVITIFILALGFSVYPTKAQYSVELVQVLFSDGERTPLEAEMWPNDPYNASTFEPWGFGQLTNQGKLRAYRTGQKLREHYNEFLGDIYYPSDIYAYSTDHDRAKMSLQLVLAGLYEPAPMQTWSKNLSWMPIPIHSMPEKVDNLMQPDFSPVYSRELEKLMKSSSIKNWFQSISRSLSEKTGKNITDLNQVLEVYNRLQSLKSMNLVLPEWCTGQMSTVMEYIRFYVYAFRSFTPELKRLNGGTLIKRFIENMKNNEKRDRPRKIYLYSGHETNIAGFYIAHKIVESGVLPSYGCAIIIEKLRDPDGKQFIRILVWTGVTEKLIPFHFVNCGEFCPIEKYLELVKVVIPSEEESNNMWDYLSKEDLYNLFEEKLTSN